MPINKLTPYRHSDKSINISLYYLRAQIIREGLDGLAHVDALLKQRGCDPAALRVPPKRVIAFRHGEFRRAVLDALRERPRAVQEIADMFANRLGHVGNANRCTRVSACLRRLEGHGLVRREGRVWGLAESILSRLH